MPSFRPQVHYQWISDGKIKDRLRRFSPAEGREQVLEGLQILFGLGIFPVKWIFVHNSPRFTEIYQYNHFVITPNKRNSRD